MAAVQAKVLYDFKADAVGELTVYSDETLTILRQDVGAGWWEAINNNGVKGLVPESYLEITSFREPSMPPPPPPSSARPPASSWSRTPSVSTPSPSDPPRAQWGTVAGAGVPSSNSSHSVGAAARPPHGRPPPPNKLSAPVVRTGAAAGVANKASSQQEVDDDGWDDDDWDDDDDSTIGEAPGGVEYSGTNNGGGPARGAVQRNDSKTYSGGTVRKPFSRFSTFAKTGGDAYLFESSNIPVPDSEPKAIIYEGPEGAAWRPMERPYQCAVQSPKKETKFHGIKSFIAYTLTPTFSNIQVSRRYKHFDWLQKRLVEKYTTIAIPPLPEKQIAGRFDDDFVGVRLKQLQLWVDRMCQHPVVAQSDVFNHFLTCTDEKKWTAGKRKAEKDEFLGGKFFLTVHVPATPLDAKHGEQCMEQFGKFVRGMDDSLRHLYAVGENNVKKHQGPFKKEYQKIGGSFTTMATSFKYDQRPSAQTLTFAIEETGKAYNDIGDMFEKQPRQDMRFLLEGVLEYKGLLSTFPESLMVHKSAATKIQESEGKLPEPELQAVQKRADVITYSVLAEMQHFQQHRTGDFKKYMQSYLEGQIAFYSQITKRLEETLRLYDKA